MISVSLTIEPSWFTCDTWFHTYLSFHGSSLLTTTMILVMSASADIGGQPCPRSRVFVFTDLWLTSKHSSPTSITTIDVIFRTSSTRAILNQFQVGISNEDNVFIVENFTKKKKKNLRQQDYWVICRSKSEPKNDKNEVHAWLSASEIDKRIYRLICVFLKLQKSHNQAEIPAFKALLRYKISSWCFSGTSNW